MESQAIHDSPSRTRSLRDRPRPRNRPTLFERVRESNSNNTQSEETKAATVAAAAAPATAAAAAAAAVPAVTKGKAHRLRNLTKMITTELRMEKQKIHSELEEFVAKHEKANDLVFDKSKFLAHNRMYGTLPEHSKKILVKPSQLRTEEELMMLKDVVDRLKCFDRYTQKIRHDLARIVYYEMYDKGRVLIKQGHIAEEFYFIVSGSVYVQTTGVNLVTKEETVEITSILNRGSSFGELELLHNMRRQATYIVKEMCSEFLKVNKHDFREVLLASHVQQLNDRLKVLRSKPLTADWPLMELSNMCSLCQLKEFPQDAIIFGNTADKADMILLTLSGTCQLVREVYLVCTVQKYGKKSYRLATPDDLKTVEAGARRKAITSGKISRIERHLWTIGKVGKGRNLTVTYTVSNRSHTVCGCFNQIDLSVNAMCIF